jgi:hypothetical protein
LAPIFQLPIARWGVEVQEVLSFTLVKSVEYDIVPKSVDIYGHRTFCLIYTVIANRAG